MMGLGNLIRRNSKLFFKDKAMLRISTNVVNKYLKCADT